MFKDYINYMRVSAWSGSGKGSRNRERRENRQGKRDAFPEMMMKIYQEVRSMTNLILSHLRPKVNKEMVALQENPLLSKMLIIIISGWMYKVYDISPR